MTPERLNYLIGRCFQLRRKDGLTAFYEDIARFLGVRPITLRRWLRGERPIPRSVEIVMEIFHGWPEVTAEAKRRGQPPHKWGVTGRVSPFTVKDGPALTFDWADVKRLTGEQKFTRRREC